MAYLCTDTFAAKLRWEVSNCNYIIFTYLSWPADSEDRRVKLPLAHLLLSRRKLHMSLFIAERQARKLRIPIFIVFGLIQSGIELRSIGSVADALTIRPLIGFIISREVGVERSFFWREPHKIPTFLLLGGARFSFNQ